MKSVLILPKIKIENANAISGILYGFPAITHFLGYTHALSRELDRQYGLPLGGCAIICHHYQMHTRQTGEGGKHRLCLTRNPVDKEGKTTFNEEGKIHLEISLLIECNFSTDDFHNLDKSELEHFIYQLAVSKRLAGGIITKMNNVQFIELPEGEDESSELKNGLKKLIPGFYLVDHSQEFMNYLTRNQISSFEGFIDFNCLKSKATITEEGSKKVVSWKRLSRPTVGWTVPIQVGFKAISPLYDPGVVDCARDKSTPFRFVEAVYGIGKWISLHRLKTVSSVIWHYQTDSRYYLCSSNNLNLN
jgi:CRISPR-associated protein Csy2